MSGLEYRLGYVTVATPTATPTVRLRGDSTGEVTRNFAAGYVPVVGHNVLVLIDDNKRVAIIGKQQ